jgi:hypothetical protein
MLDTTPTPTPERKPAWRAACLAYREKRRAGASHQAAADAARDALMAVWPLPLDEPQRETTHAKWVLEARWTAKGDVSTR